MFLMAIASQKAYPALELSIWFDPKLSAQSHNIIANIFQTVTSLKGIDLATTASSFVWLSLLNRFSWL